MYPQVTQFETRQRLLLDELQLQEERRLARLPNTALAVLTRVVPTLSHADRPGARTTHRSSAAPS